MVSKVKREPSNTFVSTLDTPEVTQNSMYTLDRNDLDNESLGGRNRKCEKNPGRKWQSRLVGSASLALQRGEKAPKTISE